MTTSTARSTDMLATIGVVCVASRWRIVVRGELDLRSGYGLVGAAGVLASARVPGAVLDLDSVTFIDTGGWNAVRQARQCLEESGTPVTVAADGPVMARFLRLVEAAEPLRRATGGASQAAAG